MIVNLLKPQLASSNIPDIYTQVAYPKYIWDNRLGELGKIITFKYQELSKYGAPRFPVWKCFREGYHV